MPRLPSGGYDFRIEVLHEVKSSLNSGVSFWIHLQSSGVRARGASAQVGGGWQCGVDCGGLGTAVAVGATHAMTVYHVQGSLIRIGYALATCCDVDGNWTWEERSLIGGTPGVATVFTDPSVAYDFETGDFLVAAMGRPTPNDPFQIVTCRWDSAAEEFGDWEVRRTSFEVDKPWLVGGEIIGDSTEQGFGDPLPGGPREFYLVWTDQTHGTTHDLAYSRFDGTSWVPANGDTIRVNGQAVQSVGWPVPSVYDWRPLYIAYLSDAQNFCVRKVRFLKGTDILSGPNTGQVQFSQLNNAQGQPLEVTLNAGKSIGYRLPGQLSLFFPEPPAVGRGVDFSVAPTNPNRLYLVYHDSVASAFPPPNCDSDPCQRDACDSDVNIYLRVLTRSGGFWSVGNEIRVDEPTLDRETDQFMPQITVDDAGIVHVIYYSDEQVDPDQLDGITAAKFDVFYAQGVWVAGQLVFTHRKLCETPSQSCQGPDDDNAIDSLHVSSITMWLRDYNGIAWGEDRIFTTFMGRTDDDTQTSEKSVIWSSQIVR